MRTTFTDDVTRLAERATLGALLTDPDRIADVTRWLRAGDFTHAWHSAIYTALREQHAARVQITVQGVAAALTGRLGVRRADLPELAGLVNAAPHQPDPVRYARMVTESGLRREVTGQGVLLRAAALHTALTGEAHPLTGGCDLVDATLDSVARRWSAARGGPVLADTTPIPLRAAARSTEVRLGADKLLRQHPPRDPHSERDHEIALVGALVAHPDQIPTVARWLPPTRITDPAWRTVYAAAVELTERAEAVDEVTVAWAVRAPAHHGSPVPDLTDLTHTVTAARFTPPGTAARTVAGDQLRRLADVGTDQLHKAAANPGVLLTDLIDTTRLLTASLRHVATALPTLASTATTSPAPVRELRPTRGPVAG